MAARVRLTPLRLIEVRDGLARRTRELAEADDHAPYPFVRELLSRYWSLAEALSVAPAWWVSSDMEALSLAAAEDGAPRDVEPGTPDGFLVFEDPLPLSVTPSLPWRIRALQWMSASAKRGAVEVGYRYFTSDPGALRERDERVLPLAEIEVGPGDDCSGTRALMDAVWALSRETRVCEAVGGERAPARSWGGTRPPDPAGARKVKFLVLRENRRSPFGGDGDGPAREYSHRFIVRGFWRNQPCGPNLSERRRQWIPPFVKGPADKPLVVKETVRIWRR